MPTKYVTGMGSIQLIFNLDGGGCLFVCFNAGFH